MATIAGAATKLTEPDAVGFDDAANLVVGDFHNLVAVFAPGATGNVAPQRVITGAATARDGRRFVERVCARLQLVTSHDGRSSLRDR